MQKGSLAVVLIFVFIHTYAQQSLSPLTVEKIMRNPKWIGTSPSGIEWNYDGSTLYFSWNPENKISDSLYYITIENRTPQKVTETQKKNILHFNALTYNSSRNAYTYEKDGDIFLTDIKSKKTQQITNTTDYETNPVFAFNDNRIVYRRSRNVYAWDKITGETIQLTNFQSGEVLPDDAKEKLNTQEAWLKNDQLRWINVLKERKEKKDTTEANNKLVEKKKNNKPIYTGGKTTAGLQISSNGRFISYTLIQQSKESRSTIIPNYVTESGFTENIPGRTKVGETLNDESLFVYDREMDTVIAVKTDSIPGIRDLPDYVKDYPALLEEKKKNNIPRAVSVSSVRWSPGGMYAVVDLQSQDNKDRWLMRLDAATGKLSLLDRQRDEAWIGGPGIGNSGWLNENTYWFQSEATGFSHIYTVNVGSGKKTAITSGKYEVQECRLSADKKYFYITTNEVHYGETQFYRLPVTGGKAERITTMEGANEVTLSPDEKYIAILYSYSNKPGEVFIQENKPGGKLQQVTDKAQTAEFKSYPWRDPELVTFTARDGAQVHARLYKPSQPAASKPAVIFVHGAGYLQNAHKWWSYYFREFMFHNLLADQGYYVLDMDYRGSAGYGRDWRTGIYRFMGGKDLTDNIDGAQWLSTQFGVDPKRIGIYGGSYGGFITLMALFTSPGTFAAGAALRPVTDWAHYNHGYTSNILNTPVEDSIAYRRSSPIYFAEGLQDHLLICHGVVDVNVHFQDVMRLNQRLIELGKNNWQVAMYPVEDHSFVEPSSWTDEYKRIYNLFEQVLKK